MHAIRFGLLGLLEQEPDHGYSLWRRFEDGVGSVWELNVGQVYGTLPALEHRGFVRAVEAEDDSNAPVTGARRPFEITAKGKRALSLWAKRSASTVEPTRDGMLVLLLVLAETQPDIALRQIDAKEKTYRQHLVRLRKRQRRLVASKQPGIMVPMLSLDFAILRAKAYLTWLDRCRLLLESGDINAVWPTEDD
jgi:DNA-binding PadR family transcriptional regulator